MYKQLVLPSPEQIAQEDLMNNCGVRTVLSGVMGAGLGAVFGVFMVTMDAAVRPSPELFCRATDGWVVAGASQHATYCMPA